MGSKDPPASQSSQAQGLWVHPTGLRLELSEGTSSLMAFHQTQTSLETSHGSLTRAGTPAFLQISAFRNHLRKLFLFFSWDRVSHVAQAGQELTMQSRLASHEPLACAIIPCLEVFVHSWSPSQSARRVQQNSMKPVTEERASLCVITSKGLQNRWKQLSKRPSWKMTPLYKQRAVSHGLQI